MRGLSALSAVLVACSLAFVPLGAQDKKGASGKGDPQSGYEPRSGPGEGQKFLEKFVGDWEVAKAFYPGSGGAPARQKGTCRQTMIHGGRFLQSDFTFEGRGGKTTGTGLIGFEPASGTFTSVWTDSRATRMSFRKSEGKFDGEQIVLYSAALGGGAPRERRRSRTVTRLEDEGRRIVHRQYAAGEGGKERLVMELVLTRKEKAATPAR
jgi:hypothetical protein